MKAAAPLAAALAGLTALPIAALDRAGDSIHPDVPTTIDPAAHYLIYLHGRIIELQGRKAVSPDFGGYEYDAILRAFAARGFVVIAEARSFDAGEAFADKVTGQVRRLLKAGVPAQNVTVAGFSKGGDLAISVAAKLADDRVSYVVMAGCSRQPAWVERCSNVKGRLLSLYDLADRFDPSCQPLFDRATGLLEKKEIVLRKGLDHGLFFAPRDDWLDPLAAWALHKPLPPF